MNRYVGIFIAANVILTLAIAGIAEVLNLKSGSGFAMTAALGASFLAAAAFAKDHARTPRVRRKGHLPGVLF